MRSFLASVVLFATTAVLPAQLSGSYTIDPAAVPPNFNSIQAAMAAAVTSGVSGPVTFNILPGTWNESVTGSMITGASAVNTVTFRALAGPGTVLLNGTSGDTFALTGAQAAPMGFLVFDGLDFVSAPAGSAITGTTYVEAMEVRNCTFGPNHLGSRHALIYSDNAGSGPGWKVHHCKMTFPPGPRPRPTASTSATAATGRSTTTSSISTAAPTAST